MAHRPLWRAALPCALLIVAGVVSAPLAHAATDYEAEDATISQGAVNSDHPGFTGRGFVNYDNLVGSYVEWTIPNSSVSKADLVIRYANGADQSRNMDVTVNGTLVSGNQPYGGTGAWETWKTSTIRTELPAGNVKIRATAKTADGGPNVDRLTVSLVDSVPPSAPANLRSTGKTFNTTSLAWDAATDNVGVTGYDVYQHGQFMKSATGLSTTVEGLTPDTDYNMPGRPQDLLHTEQYLPILDGHPQVFE
ncbi:carbohydrate-binding protein, partial [Kibdelosporangium lantanae]